MHDIWLHDCMLICVESVFDNTTNPRILQKGEQLRAGTNIGIMFSGSLYMAY